jgi:hypothetical protein
MILSEAEAWTRLRSMRATEYARHHRWGVIYYSGLLRTYITILPKGGGVDFQTYASCPCLAG